MFLGGHNGLTEEIKTRRASIGCPADARPASCTPLGAYLERFTRSAVRER